MMEPTREAGLARLAAFLPLAGRAYRATRNEDRGPEDRSNVSCLGPYVRARLVTEDEVLRAVLARHSASAAEKFVQEVFWRTYWKGWLESRPLVWEQYLRDTRAARERVANDRELRRSYEAACAGETGNAAFDAWAHELTSSGYLHNHARMWFASLWIFTLRLPWELGADFFMRTLLCGDPAANTLSWRWVAGLHTRGKTYLTTRANVRHYTLGRLDPGPDIARRAEALDGPAYAAAPLPALAQTGVVPGRAVLVLHDDDAGVDTLPLDGIDVVSSVGLLGAEDRSPFEIAPGPVAFARGAVADTLRRAPGGDPAALFSTVDSAVAARAIVERAREAGADVVVTPYAPVGPVRDALDRLEPVLAERGVTLHRIVRAFDALAWPHATRGFFNLKAKIPTIVSELGLGGEAPA